MGSLVGYSILNNLGLALCNSFGTREVSFVVVSLGILSGLMIGTGEGSLIGLSLGLPLDFPIDSPNPGCDMPDMLLGAHAGSPLGYSINMFLGLELWN